MRSLPLLLQRSRNKHRENKEKRFKLNMQEISKIYGDLTTDGRESVISIGGGASTSQSQEGSTSEASNAYYYTL